MKCFNSKAEKHLAKALSLNVFVLSCTLKVLLSDCHFASKVLFDLDRKQPQGGISNSNTPSEARPIRLAQSVSRGTETELWCQSGFSRAALQRHDSFSQMDPG
ncbi:hypothetical protein ILYODFUR_000904 [Ilyodon furcidens]|uniref:Uncharacterized protein n=1 Tax=Ilyodon furcidens TaxID=33524 RepID=A0ABV0VA15_9TELE